MNKDKRSLPPVIRVFLSSTFADMDKERSYFNEVLVPKINRLCAERGVSFFSVDLRWGITEEEQIDGKVLPICLSEIDKCRPYFIGILGNRYGSVLETVPEKISDMIPWLKGKEGHSITELEMLYAVLEHNDEETLSNCAFYFRSDNLTEQLYGHLKCEDVVSVNNLRNLKQCIAEDPDTPCSEYSSIEEFGSFVMRDILNWLDRHFPESEDIDAIRSEWYNSEILRNHAPNTELNSFLDSYISQSKKPLLIYGDGARGKTASLTAWTPMAWHKVLVNCGADDKYIYWPSIADEIVKQLIEILRDNNDTEALDKVNEIEAFLDLNKSAYSKANDGANKSLYFRSENSIEKFRSGFVQLLSELETRENIVIVINDLNLLEDLRSRLLCWLPSTTGKNVKLVCSTNDEEMMASAEVIGWNLKEMPLTKPDRAKSFLREYLGTFGKSLSPAQLDLIISSEASQYPGLLRFIIRFLINHGRFENLDSLIVGLCECGDIQEIYHYIFSFLMEDYSDNERKIIRCALGIVRASMVSLVEKECYELVSKSCEISPIEWAKVCRALEQFEIVHGDYWNVRNEETYKFIDSILSDNEKDSAQELLGDYIMSILSDASGEKDSALSSQIGRRYGKAALSHYQNAKAYDKLLSALKNDFVLKFLYLGDWSTVRAGWMHLFLHTEIDLVENLSELAELYHIKGEYYNQRISDMLIGLLIDFEYYTEVDILCDRLGIERPYGTIDSSSEGVTRKFAVVNKKIHNLKITGNYRSVLEYVEQVMTDKTNFSEMDNCQLLNYKSEAESKLGLFDEAVETVNDYYRLAIRMGYFFEMRRALAQRAYSLFQLERYDEAIQICNRNITLALVEGEIRSYLGGLNLIAMINYRIGKCDESIAAFDDMFKYWSKIGDINELSATVLNRGNALSYKGDDKGALSYAEEWYNIIKDDASLRPISTTILGNMGYYAYECAEYEKAEKFLVSAVKISKSEGYESSLLKSYSTLISLYTTTNNFGKKVEIYQNKLELLWSRKEYEKLAEDLKKIVDELLIYKHNAKARELERYWKNKFTTISGGLKYLKSEINSESIDSISLDSLLEQLVVARSEKDEEKIIQCYFGLYEATKNTDYETSIDYLLSAIGILNTMNRESEAVGCFARAIELVFDEGKTKSEDLLKRILEKSKDEKILEIVRLWQCFNSQEIVNVYDVLESMTSYIPKYEAIVSAAFIDLKHYAVSCCSSDELLSLVKKLSDNGSRYSVVTAWRDLMLEDIHKNEAKLFKDYMSPEAIDLISYFEKSIDFLSVYDRGNAATLAGNIAIIFRRRGDKEKTLYYHKLSMDIFSEQNKPRDCLIEMTNLATAYREFGDADKAIDLLREAVLKADEACDMQQRALIADNLADFLRIRGRAEDREEILRCFEIGESFFRSAGYTRDLVISLRNQILYLVNNDAVEAWEPKLREMKAIVRENGFGEFEQSVVYLEWFAAQQRRERKTVTIEEAEEKVKLLLENYPKGCNIVSRETTEGYYKFRALPNEPLGGREELFIFYDINNDNKINLLPAFIPSIKPTNLDKLDEYMDWWNKIGAYSLKWEKENGYLYANIILISTDFDGLCDTFRDRMSLWLIDKTATMAIFSDACEISDLQGMKLKMMDKN